MTSIPYISAAEVRSALPMAKAIDVMHDAFRALGEGRVSMPQRIPINTPGGVTFFMPGYVATDDGGQLAQKIVSVYGGNRSAGLPVIHALVTVLDPRTGAPKAILDGTYLTALRTGAVSGLATRYLARHDTHVLTIIGAGGQAASQIEAVCAVRPIQTVNIISRGDSAATLAARLSATDPSRRYVAANATREAALRVADVIVTSTASTSPLFDGAWVKEGAHVNAIGAYRPDMCEVDASLLRRSAVYVDQRAAALEEAGDLLIPSASGEWSMDSVRGDLAELVLGRVTADPQRTTLFKSCGLAVEDIAAAAAIVAALGK